jgi:hypothetical protein
VKLSRIIPAALSVASIVAVSAPAGAARPTAPVVTPSQASTILAKLDAVDAKANAALSPKLLSTVETGPALAVDTRFYAANKKAGIPFPVSQVSGRTVFVPRQTSFPAFFVASETLTDSKGNDVVSVYLIQQATKGAPWKIALYANGTSGTPPPDITLDASGYALVAAQKKGPAEVSPTRALCLHFYSPGANGDVFTPGDDAGIGDFVQQAVTPGQAAAAAKHHKFASRCVPQTSPVASLQSSDGRFVILSATFVTTETGTKASPAVVAPPAAGQTALIPPGRYLATRYQDIVTMAADVQDASNGAGTPVDATFGQIFNGLAVGAGPVK